MNTRTWAETADDLSELVNDPQPLKYTAGNNLLIIDGNNLGFRFLRRANYNSYEAEYIRTVESLGKSYSAKEIVVSFDFGKSYFRKEIFPEYKENRKAPETEEDKKHFEEFFSCLNRVADVLPFTSLKLRGIESDDIMAYLILKLKNKYDHIWVISSDRDIYQLLDTNVSIFNLYSRKEINLKFLETEWNITPLEYQLARIIQGDSGDGIPGIAGIGEVRSRDLARKYKTLPDLLKSLPIKGTSQYIKNLNAGKEILLRNEKLINLIDYHEQAILAGKDGEQYLDELRTLIS